MNESKAKVKKKDDSAENQVAEYLSSNPDFFIDRDDLLLQMNLPHGRNGEAISLVEHQVSLLRERNRNMRKQLDQYIASAKHNDRIFEKTRRLVLALIAAQDSDQFFKALEDSFKNDFEAVAYSLIIFSKRSHQINHFTSSVSAESADKFVGSLMKRSEPTLGSLRANEQDFLFRHASDRVGSAAVVSIEGKRRIGLLSIGSEDPHYFQAGMGTLFVGFIAETLAKLLPRYIYIEE